MNDVINEHVRRLIQMENELIEQKLYEAMTKKQCGVVVTRRFSKLELSDERAYQETTLSIEVDPDIPYGEIHYHTEY